MKDDFRRLGKTCLAELLAPSIRDDATIAAIAASLSPLLASVVRSIPNLLLWARLTPDSAFLSPLMRRLVDFSSGLKPLSDEELELLAWQEHVDFWRPDWPRKVREDLVRNSTRWHRIKGTPSGLKQALALFGHHAIIEERTPGLHWSAYQLGINDIPDMETVREIREIAGEMHPARCKLWRMYNPEYDRRPTIWGVGPATSTGWSCGYYARWSGVPVPEIDDELIVSFGSRKSWLTEAFDTRVASGVTLLVSGLVAYIIKPIWGRGAYAATFPRRYSFTIQSLLSFHFAVPELTSFEWEGEWDERHWAELVRWNRYPPRRPMRIFFIQTLSALAAGQAGLSGQIGIAFHTELTAVIAGLTAASFAPPRYGFSIQSLLSFRWNRDPSRKPMRILFIQTLSALAAGQTGLSGQTDSSFGAELTAVMADLTAASAAPLRDGCWEGEWDDRRWDGGLVYVCITNTEAECI